MAIIQACHQIVKICIAIRHEINTKWDRENPFCHPSPHFHNSNNYHLFFGVYGLFEVFLQFLSYIVIKRHTRGGQGKALKYIAN
jgi:hypothetical protein